MELSEMRNKLSVSGKNGIGFLLSAVVIWSIITVIFLQPIETYQKNIFMLFSTGLMFPLSIGISTLLKADWKFKDIPLGNLGMYLNVAQIIYFPILIWAIVKNPEVAVIFFAIIVGAHFFPYGWLYDAKAYYIMAPLISVIIMTVGLYLVEAKLWLIPLCMVVLFLILILLVYIDYKKKFNHAH
ncbi:DUF7010 family protein [Aquibacillus rhizosphaerae]|uniref:EamA domain-containing protein n=1 Tax=Aquibacillus rhizosphaerae TaxID=3051431 RepID=A0ABT7LDJ1_9BACI|nr:hypothetical protein [Aquibacillus sp. LR5S19]MDL4843245.1 hypothetical protein [Aquibacillus sp. LR5S19]